MELALYNEPPNPNLYGIIIFILLILSLRKKDNDTLKYLPLLVKINIMDSEAKKRRRIIRNKMKELSPDTFKQMWLGRFHYMYAGYLIDGMVELRNDQVFSVAENNAWLFDNSNVNHILTHLAKYRITEIPSWNSKITCTIILRDGYKVRHFFIPIDVLTERHSQNIQWEKKLFA